MKKILILIAMLAIVGTAYAQKSQEVIEKAIASAVKASQDPKKSEKPATWTTLAQKYLDAYLAPQGAGWVGSSKNELDIIMNTKPVSTQEETYEGNTYSVNVYANCKYYFLNNVLQMIVVTKPYVEDALEKARAAYEQAGKVDPTGSKLKDITAGLTKVNEYFINDAYSQYTLGNMQNASDLFAAAAKAKATEPLAEVDTESMGNSAYCAFAAGNYEFAKTQYLACIEAGFYKDGDYFAKLAECYEKLGDMESYKATLQDGFVKCPSSQAVLINLINYYVNAKEDPAKIFELLAQAKQNEPKNASLYNAEANILKELDRTDEAIAEYAKCIEVDSTFVYGEIGRAELYLKKADEINDKAQREFNDKKYQELLVEFYAALNEAVEPYTKAFEVSKDSQIKLYAAERLKNIYYYLVKNDSSLQPKYDFYNEYARNNR